MNACYLLFESAQHSRLFLDENEKFSFNRAKFKEPSTKFKSINSRSFCFVSCFHFKSFLKTEESKLLPGIGKQLFEFFMKGDLQIDDSNIHSYL